MSTVQEIEQAIGKLAPQELDDLYAWMEEHYAQSADARLKADLDAGHMDSRIRKALAGSARAPLRESAAFEEGNSVVPPAAPLRPAAAR